MTTTARTSGSQRGLKKYILYSIIMYNHSIFGPFDTLFSFSCMLQALLDAFFDPLVLTS